MKSHLRKFPGWHRLVLDYLDEDEAAAWGGESQHQSVAPFLSLSPDFTDLLQGFTKKKRYKIRAAIAAAESAGASFHVATNPREQQEYLEMLFCLHALRSDEIGRESSLAGEAALHLHRDLVRHSAAVRLFALVLKGRPLAILYGFLHYRRFAYYQVAHDPAFASLSPGSVLLSRVIEWCCQHDLQEIDFLQGDESYKFRWACGQRELKRTMITSGRPAARFASCVDGAIKSVRSRLGGAA